MARYFKLLILLSMTLLASCQEGGEAGDLQGQWRLAGTDSCYVSFSGSVVLFRLVVRGEVYGSFQHTGDSLFMQCYTSGRPMFDPAVTDTFIVEKRFGLKPFNDIRLKIDKLTDDQLRLSRDGQTWEFDKW